MNKEIITKGFAEAEKQQQEDQVQKIKEMVLKHLEKIDYHQKLSQEHAEKAKLVKKDLDDLKAGRLDRIEERHDKDEKTKEVRIIEVHKIIDRYLPLRPWYSPYEIAWYYNGSGLTYSSGSIGITTSTSGTAYNLPNTVGQNLTVTGANCSNFVGGTYSVNGQTINL